jgi:hypothetical protein
MKLIDKPDNHARTQSYVLDANSIYNHLISNRLIFLTAFSMESLKGGSKCHKMAFCRLNLSVKDGYKWHVSQKIALQLALQLAPQIKSSHQYFIQSLAKNKPAKKLLTFCGLVFHYIYFILFKSKINSV